MPLIDLTGDGVTTRGYVCGRGLHGCYLCGLVADYQCDRLVVPGTKRRCNRYICSQHRTSLTPNKDACPEHAAACLAALERRRLARD